MKQFLFLLSVVLFFSCGNSSTVKINHKPIVDSSVRVIYPYGTGLRYARAKYSTSVVKTVDSNDVIHEKIDTAWTVEIPKDTAKESNGKIILDSATHQPKINMQLYKLTLDENKNVKIQIVTI